MKQAAVLVCCGVSDATQIVFLKIIYFSYQEPNSKAYILNPNIELGKATVISYVSRLSFVIIDICIAAILLFL